MPKYDIYKKNVSPTGGFVDIMFDEQKWGSEKDEISILFVPMSTTSNGLFYKNPEFPIERFRISSIPEKFEKKMFRWTATKISSLKYAQRKPRQR